MGRADPLYTPLVPVRLPVLILLALLTGCVSQTTQRRIIHYSSVGVGRDAPEARPSGVVHAGIRWIQGDLAAAQGEARRLKRPLMVYVKTVWCGPCKRLKKSTFKDAGVIALMNGRVAAFELDGESDEGKRFVKARHITSYPTMLFFRPGGEEIDRSFGYQRAEMFRRMVDNMLHDRGTVGDMRRQLKSRPKDVALLHRLGMHLALRGDTREAQTHLRSAVALDPKDKAGLASQSLWVIGRYVHRMKTRNLVAAAAAFNEVLKRFPKSRAARTSGIDLASLHVRKKRKKEAFQALKAMVKGDSKDAHRVVEAAWFCHRKKLPQSACVTWARRATQLRADGYPWAALGALYGDRRDRKAQIKALKEAVKRSPNQPQYRAQLMAAEAAPR